MNTLGHLDLVTVSKNYFKKDHLWVASGWQSPMSFNPYHLAGKLILVDPDKISLF
jgi:hypothetical protein